LQSTDIQGLLVGDPAGIRTQDPYIKSVLLYQLSYGIGAFFEKRGKDMSVLPKKNAQKKIFFSESEKTPIRGVEFPVSAFISERQSEINSHTNAAPE
jgi:hypothetical protein